MNDDVSVNKTEMRCQYGSDYKFVDTIGANIKDIRINRKTDDYTVKYMVSEINKLLPGNSKITEGLYYKWESEERSPTVRQIPAIAKALGVTESTLFHFQERERGTHSDDICLMNEELMAMDITRMKKLVWMLASWSGDTAALIEFAVLYINLFFSDREYIASFGIRLYDICRKEGKLNNDYPKPDIEYLKKVLNYHED